MQDEAKRAMFETIAERLTGSFGCYLPHDQAKFLLRYAQEQEKRAERFLKQAQDGARSYQDLLAALQKGQDEADRLHKEHADLLRGIIARKDRTIRVLSVLLLVALATALYNMWRFA